MAQNSAGMSTGEDFRGFAFLDPRVKFLLAAGFILTLSILPPGDFVLYLVLLLILYVTASLSRVPPLRLLKRSVIAVPFALAALSLLVTVSGTTLFSLPAFNLAVSIEGTIRFVSVVLKSWISVQAAVLLIALTDFSDLMWGLQALRMPSILVAIGSFGYRYLDVLRNEASRLRIAREARSAVRPGRRPGGGILWRARVTGWLIGSLMTRSMERSDRIYSAMLARGYSGRIKTLKKFTITAVDYGVLVGAVFFYGLILLASILV